ncbi:MAG TPA: flagellar hook basal-body protein [Phycisphaerales bacterium]|nr:flagellar hook basal-body protein [Phycisphaerales bacterium]
MSKALILSGVSIALLNGCEPQLDPWSWSGEPLLATGASGGQALPLLQRRLAVAAENLANLDTPGYRRTIVLGPSADGRAVEEISLEQGAPVRGRVLDVMLTGPGFFRVGTAETSYYTRCGRFTLDAEGEIVLALRPELYLLPRVTVPLDAVSLTIDSGGSIHVVADSRVIELGRVRLTTFISAGRLKRVDRLLFAHTDEAGPPIEFDAGPGEYDTAVLQGYYECSTVDPRAEQLEIDRIRKQLAIWTEDAPPAPHR